MFKLPWGLRFDSSEANMDSTIIQAVLPSFAIAFLGYVYSRVDRQLDVKSIANLIYYVFSPCLVFSSLVKTKFELHEFFLIGCAVIVLIFSLMLITFIYMKVANIQENGFYLPIIFMNTGNIALPMSLFLYGNEGMSKAIVFHLVNVAFLYSMGVLLVSKKSDLKQFFKIPFLYAGLLAMAVAWFPFNVASPVRSTLVLVGKGIDLLGSGSIPLLILSLGYSLNRTRLGDLKDGLIGGGLRVLVGPLIAFGIVALFRFLGWSSSPANQGQTVMSSLQITEATIILMAAMPAPILSFLLNEKFDSCPEKAASMVLTGSLASIITIPLVLVLSHRFIFGG